MIDWSSPETQLLLNPRYPAQERSHLAQLVDQFPFEGALWLRSSGTESSSYGIKLVHLEKVAILAAAQSMNQWLQIGSNDIWLNPLPIFHIGGLSISARCHLSGAREVLQERWDTDLFFEILTSHKVTVTSLVPTQVFDLVRKNMRCPHSLTRVLVGGGALDEDLFLKARDLGWPLLPSYGMTETSAALACAPLSSLSENQRPEMEVLPHLDFFGDGERVAVRSRALFSGYLFVKDESYEYLERPEPFVLDDRLLFKGRQVRVLGRESELVKILGETVNLKSLEEKIKKLVQQEVLVVPKPHERNGFQLELKVEGEESYLPIEKINESLMPFERISKISFAKTFPRSELGKILRSQL